MTIYEKISKAFRVSVPVITLDTADAAQSIRNLVETFPEVNIVSWDIVRLQSVPPQPNHGAATEAAQCIGDCFTASECIARAFDEASSRFPERTILIIHNAHRYFDDPAMLQAIWNARDVAKSRQQMLVLMGSSVRVPADLENDVLSFHEPLPTVEELGVIAQRLAEDAGLKLSESQRDSIARASSGLSAFAAEQIAAINASRASGIDTMGVWQDKCGKINDTPGLRVVSEGSFDKIAGVENAKYFTKRLVEGSDGPNAIVFIDEIEKALAGSSHDTSGVTQDQLGVLLQYMQDRRVGGSVLVGPPGTCKSAFAKAAGGSSGIPTIQLDLGGMKDSLIGSSESRIRAALDVIDAMSGGNTLWLATCNSVATLPPELRRRFRYGTWFFDLPTREEREAIWSLYCEAEVPEDVLGRSWTGAEIEACSDIVRKTGMSIDEAADYIVPVSVSSADAIEQLRAQADGRFLSAASRGVYTREATAKSGGRRFVGLD